MRAQGCIYRVEGKRSIKKQKTDFRTLVINIILNRQLFVPPCEFLLYFSNPKSRFPL